MFTFSFDFFHSDKSALSCDNLQDREINSTINFIHTFLITCQSITEYSNDNACTSISSSSPYGVRSIFKNDLTRGNIVSHFNRENDNRRNEEGEKYFVRREERIMLRYARKWWHRQHKRVRACVYMCLYNGRERPMRREGQVGDGYFWNVGHP